jgi:hypothetical protein
MLALIAQWQRGMGMRKALNPEIALGFLVATVLWIGVLGWQASYTPTDSEKRQCEEAATKAGHKAEECKTLWQRTTSDPVAFFTFWLVVSTVGLGVSTVLLWRAGEKQLRHARRSVAIQSRDMRASIETSTRAAKAAEDSVLISRQVGQAQVRAYLSCEGAAFTVYRDYISCEVRFRNHGQSPAIWTEIIARVFTGTVVARDDGTVGPALARSKTTTSVGPAIAAGQIGKILILFLHADMGRGAHDAVWKEGRSFDVRGQVKWRDVFDEMQTQTFFLDRVVSDDGSDPFVPERERSGELESYNAANET